MAEVIRETVQTNVPYSSNRVAQTAPVQTVRSVRREPTDSYTTQNLVYFLFGVLEFLLIFRVIFKMLGANPSSGFVSFIYGITGIFVAPFAGIFRPAVTQGAEVSAVLEPASLVAIVVYALIAWGIVKLIAIVTKEPESA